jgi:hypothetical protein
MRLVMMAAAAAGALGAVGLDAQQSAAPEERRAHNVYVLEGCLTAGRDGTNQYVLTNAKAKGTAPPAAGPEEGAAADTEYLLRGVSGITESGASDDELQMHVGFLVEVAARPPELAPEPKPSPGVVSEGNAALPKVAAEPAPVVFTVSSVTRQGGRCG